MTQNEAARKAVNINIRIHPAQKAAYEAAAQEAGMSLSEWMRYQLNKAAGI